VELITVIEECILQQIVKLVTRREIKLKQNTEAVLASLA